MVIDNRVTATVSTKGRFHTTFPLMLTSLLNQTIKPCRLIIYDDNDVMEDLRENEIYKNLFMMLQQNNIKWEVTPGEHKGQVFNHQRALTDVKTEWIWRLDDDNIMESNVLESLLTFAVDKKELGAIGPLILDPKSDFKHCMASNKMEDIYLGLNVQWCNTHLQQYIEVDHLQGSTFLFRKEAGKHGYDLNLSRVGHREETIFTHEMKRNGWKLAIFTGAKTWHVRYGAGGIRAHNDSKLFRHDEDIFTEYMRKWGVVPSKIKVIPLDNGIGDHYAFRMILPDIKKKYEGYRIIIGACFSDVFRDETGVEIVSLNESFAFVKPDDCNIYRWMDNHNWKGKLKDAFKEMYQA